MSVKAHLLDTLNESNINSCKWRVLNHVSLYYKLMLMLAAVGKPRSDHGQCSQTGRIKS